MNVLAYFRFFCRHFKFWLFLVLACLWLPRLIGEEPLYVRLDKLCSLVGALGGEWTEPGRDARALCLDKKLAQHLLRLCRLLICG